MILIMRCEKCNHLNGNVNGEVVRSNTVCECSCHDIPTDEAAQHSVQADGTDGLVPQWICMTCKTVIGPIVDDGENRCNCKDDYLIELWRVAPVVETPRR